MAMVGDIPKIVVLALGAGALGGPDALQLLVALAGQNPIVDIGICVFVLAVVTAQLLGAALLMRFVRKAPAVGARAPATTDYLARVTLLLSLAAAFVVTACLVVLSSGLGSFRLLVNFAAEYYRIVILIGAVAAAGASLRCAMPLIRVLRERRNARGAAPGDRSTTTHRTVRFVGLPLVAAVCAVLVATPSVGRGGLDALRAGFAIMPVAVAAVCAVLVATTSVGRGGLDALRRSAGFPIMPVTVAVAAVCAVHVATTSVGRGGLDALRRSAGFTIMPVTVAVGATLLVGIYRRARA